jgi:long-chain-fatty-acid--CoA ligase ACSBG
MRGRTCFLGYYKNDKATMEVYDSEGYVHSGDLGSLPGGFLEITGRIKELIITAGGENIPPIMIEDTVKEECPIISNIMVIGDNRRFLSAIIALKVKMNVKDNSPTNELTNECKMYLKNNVEGTHSVNTV